MSCKKKKINIKTTIQNKKQKQKNKLKTSYKINTTNECDSQG